MWDVVETSLLTLVREVDALLGEGAKGLARQTSDPTTHPERLPTGREPLAATSIDQRESSFVLTYPPQFLYQSLCKRHQHRKPSCPQDHFRCWWPIVEGAVRPDLIVDLPVLSR